jgi:hypothetical protein
MFVSGCADRMATRDLAVVGVAGGGVGQLVGEPGLEAGQGQVGPDLLHGGDVGGGLVDDGGQGGKLVSERGLGRGSVVLAGETQVLEVPVQDSHAAHRWSPSGSDDTTLPESSLTEAFHRASRREG